MELLETSFRIVFRTIKIILAMEDTISRRTLIKQGGLALAALAMPFPITAFTKFNMMTDIKNFDVIIIGGSYAGLSAAMALGRSLKSVLIIDSGKPCNRFTPLSHNFITQDGAVPSKIAMEARSQVLKYDTIKFHLDTAVNGRKVDSRFFIDTQDGGTFSAKKLVIATGVKDIFLSVKGFAECWGKSIIHCPYCHGYEFKGMKTAIVANGEKAFHLAALVNNLTDKLTIITQGNPDFKESQLIKLEKNRISIITKEVLEAKHQNGDLKELVFKDGSMEKFDAAYAVIPFEQHSRIPQSLGCEITEMNLLKVDMFQKTNIPGLYACGDSSSPLRSVAYAVATGNIAGSMVNNELTMEEF